MYSATKASFWQDSQNKSLQKHSLSILFILSRNLCIFAPMNQDEIEATRKVASIRFLGVARASFLHKSKAFAVLGS